jgi:hypothetical protein
MFPYGSSLLMQTILDGLTKYNNIILRNKDSIRFFYEIQLPRILTKLEKGLLTIKELLAVISLFHGFVQGLDIFASFSLTKRQ